MKWTFRWYGQDDPVTLDNIRQIPNMYGVVGTLVGKLPGDVWQLSEIEALKKDVEAKGLKLAGIESVSVHDAIKAGTADRDKYIDNYKETIRNLGKSGVDVICYSFKPIFGWAKTNLNYELPDGSITLEYDDKIVQQIEPKQMYGLISGQTSGFQLSGWEPGRLERFNELEAMYEGITEEKLFDNLKYFLEAVIPVCEEYGVKMAIHPDDPPFDMFEYPRITKNKADILKIVNAVDSPCNGVTFCTGSYGANPENDLVDMIHSLKGKIHFAHLRNVKILGERHFLESAHLSKEGSLDMYAIVKALDDIGFDGIARPDHGRTIWNEIARPGYGLYDRALGLSYLQGLEEAVHKSKS
ncbi:mannonate dehydratase [Aerococcus agrisoli]|uniref:Mannonate dehydratase n=1 Tax=Aerococcus agrisoli TaxID=2487350 RepID=A0A3N4GLI6_9LACT|nr:mannonate dehydratase [Aerococcus agrisoli]RPA63702.1 mannonate dehydratase [Aerococcus agrisoli]